jgi:hypothetical protein
MKKYSVLIFVIMLYISLYMASPCKAEVVWSDNFDDGNYDGWYAMNGVFSVEDHTLKPVSGDNNYWISHISTVDNGTWSFDALVGEGIVVWITWDFNIENGLFVAIFSISDGTHLRLFSFDNGNQSMFGEYILSSSTSSWQHIDVTRDVDGRTCVYLNRTLYIDVVDHVVRKSQVLWYEPYEGASIDNIVVSNTVDIEPPPQPFYMQTWFLATVGAVAVVAIILVIFLRHKKNS